MTDGSRLPSMIALRCAVVAARTGNFTQAAQELHLTQSAVSRQIAKLEADLGVKLFVRSGPRLALTARGRAFTAAVEPALAIIAAATARHRSNLGAGVISLATLPSFGMRWLAPRLARLTREAPELTVNLSARSDEFDFATEVHDAAIHFGAPSWPKVECERLFGERSLAVASPALLAGADGEDLLGTLPLLAMSNRQDAWEAWARETGRPSPRRSVRAHYEHFAMLAQAAIAGAGAALIPEFLVREEIATGQLAVLSDRPLTSSSAYHLVYPKDRLERSSFRKFRRWLHAEARAEREAYSG